MNPFTTNPLNERMAAGVRRVGFRKWYERELLSSHAHMLLTLLSTIALMASFEAFKGATLAEKMLDVTFIIACAVIGLWSLRRYLYLLMHAEEVANQAVCPACSVYGRFKVVAEDIKTAKVQVCCNKCYQLWDIDS